MNMDDLLNMGRKREVPKAPNARDEQEICFTSLPIPSIKPHVSEVLIQTPSDGYFYILVNGLYANSDSSCWAYVADKRTQRKKVFSDRSEVLDYLAYLKFRGYDLKLIKVIQEFDFDRGGEFGEIAYSKMVSTKRTGSNGVNRASIMHW